MTLGDPVFAVNARLTTARFTVRLEPSGPAYNFVYLELATKVVSRGIELKSNEVALDNSGSFRIGYGCTMSIALSAVHLKWSASLRKPLCRAISALRKVPITFRI